MDFFTTFPYVLTLALAIQAAYLNTPKAKGRRGERRVSRKIRHSGKNYRVLDDIMIRRRDGRTSQIDHIAVGPAGVFVVETKNYRGEVKGADYERYWTVGRHRFFNPVRQNASHIRALNELLGDATIPYIPMVVFPDKTKYSMWAKDVYTQKEMQGEILGHPERFLSDEKIASIVEAIKAANITSKKERRAHVKRIRRTVRHEKWCNITRRCPECGGRLYSFTRNDERYYSCKSCDYNSFRIGRVWKY